MSNRTGKKGSSSKKIGNNINKIGEKISKLGQLVNETSSLGLTIDRSPNSKNDKNPSSDRSNPVKYDGFANGKEYYTLISESSSEDTYLNKYSVKKDKKGSNEGQPLFGSSKGFKLPKNARPTIETLLKEMIRPESLCENLINNSLYSYSNEESKKSITIMPLNATDGEFKNETYMPKVYKILVTDDTDLNKNFDERIINENYILIGAYKKELVEKKNSTEGDIRKIAVNYLKEYDESLKNNETSNAFKNRQLVLFKWGRGVEIKDMDSDEYNYLRDYLDTFIKNYQTKKSQTSEPVTQPSETPASPQPSSNLESKTLESEIKSGETKDYDVLFNELKTELNKSKEQYSNLEKKIEEITKLMLLTEGYKTSTENQLKAQSSQPQTNPSLETLSSQSQTTSHKPPVIHQLPSEKPTQSQTTQLPKKSISEYILNELTKSNGSYVITYKLINNESNNKDYDIVCKFDFKEGKKVVSTSDGNYDSEYIRFISTLETALGNYYESERRKDYQNPFGKVFEALKENEGLKNQLKDIDVKSVNIKIGKFENSEDYYIKDLYIERDNSGFFGFFRKLFGKGYLKLDHRYVEKEKGRYRDELYFENVKRDIAENYINTGLEGYQRNLFENLTSSQSSGSTQSQTTQPSQNQEQIRMPIVG